MRWTIPFLLCAAAFCASVKYSYDDAGRLVKAEYDNGTTITYTYDKAGNQTGRTVTTPASSDAQSSPESKKGAAPKKR